MGDRRCSEAGGAPIIAGTGSNDTRHTVELTERAELAGARARPSWSRPTTTSPTGWAAGADFRAVAQSTDVPVALDNIPSRSVIDMPNDLLAEREDPNIVATKQTGSDEEHAADRRAWTCWQATMMRWRKRSTMAAPAGTAASHLVGPQMHRIVEEPDRA